MKLFSRKKRHFRAHKDIVKYEVKYHPKYVFGETNDKYFYYGITEERKYDKSHNNRELKENPNTKRKYKDSYIHKKHRVDKKENFSSVLKNYKFHPDDKKYIDDKIDKKFK